MEYRVVVGMYVNADTPQNAARKMAGLISMKDSPARCFCVENLKTNEAKLVDIQEEICHV